MNADAGGRKIQRGYGSAERPVTQELWNADSRPAIPAMLEGGNHDPDYKTIDYRRYYDPDYARQELDKVWMKSWLFACREEDLPNVGDRVPSDVGPLSFIIVRSGQDEFVAFYNSCLHRGRKLCTEFSNAESIRCPYHSWEWKNDGSLKSIPSHWDFRDVTPKNGRLREVKLGRWGGFIFVNADPDAASLEEALSVMPEHFKGYDVENRYTAGRFRKLVRANWKISQEAFQESYHVIGTHPQAIPYNGDSQAKYDIWASPTGNVGRQVTPSGVPSMHAGPEANALEAAFAYAYVTRDWHYPGAPLPELDPAGDVRSQVADWHRDVQRRFYGKVIDTTDTVMIDSSLYFMFPHFTLWMSESLPFVYRFTPHERDPEMSYFEVRMLRPCRDDMPRPAPVPVIEVGPDENIADKAPDFGALGVIFDQDMDNIPLVQAGVRTADPARHYQTLGTYQEAIMQHWHAVIDQLMGN